MNGRCLYCGGDGWKSGKRCPACHGSGERSDSQEEWVQAVVRGSQSQQDSSANEARQEGKGAGGD